MEDESDFVESLPHHIANKIGRLALNNAVACGFSFLYVTLFCFHQAELFHRGKIIGFDSDVKWKDLGSVVDVVAGLRGIIFILVFISN